MNRVCNTCNIQIDEKKELEDRTVGKSCYNKHRRTNNNKQNRQPKIDKIINKNDNNPGVSTYESHACFVIGPRNVGKTYYILKIVEKTGNKRPINIKTRSPNQYPNYKTSRKLNQETNTKDQS